jgi:membrane protein implicated in regulation of membrane protease activity
VLLYFAIALIGVLFLIASAILGEALDFFDSADGFDDGTHPVSGKTIAIALTAFGATGMITSSYDWDPTLGAITSALSALFLAALAWWLISALHRQAGTTDFNMESTAGRRGEVTVGIPAGSVGEIFTSSGVGTHHLIARSRDGQAIPPGTTVRVVESRGSMVIVERLDEQGLPASEPRSAEG